MLFIFVRDPSRPFTLFLYKYIHIYIRVYRYTYVTRNALAPARVSPRPSLAASVREPVPRAIAGAGRLFELVGAFEQTPFWVRFTVVGPFEAERARHKSGESFLVAASS